MQILNNSSFSLSQIFVSLYHHQKAHKRKLFGKILLSSLPSLRSLQTNLDEVCMSFLRRNSWRSSFTDIECYILKGKEKPRIEEKSVRCSLYILNKINKSKKSNMTMWHYQTTYKFKEKNRNKKSTRLWIVRRFTILLDKWFQISTSIVSFVPLSTFSRHLHIPLTLTNFMH